MFTGFIYAPVGVYCLAPPGFYNPVRGISIALSINLSFKPRRGVFYTCLIYKGLVRVLHGAETNLFILLFYYMPHYQGVSILCIFIQSFCIFIHLYD